MSETKIKQITPEIIKNLKAVVDAEIIYKVKKITRYHCPVQKAEVDGGECHGCKHNFGNLSERSIYCIPELDKNRYRRFGVPS